MTQIVRYTQAQVATTAVPFSNGRADALYIAATIGAGLTLTLIDGSTVAIGNVVLGSYIYIQCVSATFATAGAVIALRV